MRVAVLGSEGVMGRNHVRVLRQLGHDVVRVDINGGDYAELTDAPLCEVACIATPVEALELLTLEALALGMDVMVEKPFGVVLEGRINVGYTEVFNPVVEVIADQLPRVGRIKTVHADRLGLPPARPVPPVTLDLMTHDIAVLLHLGLEPVECLGVMGDEAVATANLKLKEGNASLKASHRETYKTRRLRIEGTKGTLHADYQEQTLVYVSEDHIERVPVRTEEPLVRQWRAFPDGVSVTQACLVRHWAETLSPVSIAA